MNILVYFASPRENGSTAKMLDAFLSALPEKKSVTVLPVYKMNPLPCIACAECDSTFTCPRHDLDFTDEYLREADAVVFATPIYNCSVPSPLKAVLDRFQKYYAAKERGERIFEAGKKGVLLLSLGRSGSESIPLVASQVKNAFNALGCEFTGTAYANFTDTRPVSDEQLEGARELAKELSRELSLRNDV